MVPFLCRTYINLIQEFNFEQRGVTILHDQATQVNFSEEYSEQQRDELKEQIRRAAEEQMKLITSMVHCY